MTDVKADLEAIAPPELVDAMKTSPHAWGVLTAVLDWRRQGMTAAECRAEIQARLDDPADVSQNQIVGDAIRAVITFLSTAQRRTIVESLRSTYERKFAEDQAAQASRKAALSATVTEATPTTPDAAA